ncbi:MAG: hypothetical protein DWQ01_10790 [Planctomycetota bacterium]|nr:MAG: hypothetical protein DWQ01_10790 [Planctomycetota bacterium]
MRLPLLLTCLVLLASCQSESLQDGDRLYRTGRFIEALAAYQAAEGSDPDLDLKIAQTRYRIVAEEARQQIHLDHPQEALGYLDVADQLLPNMALTAELRQRAARELAVQFTRRGQALFEQEKPAEALALFSLAVEWDPSNESAVEWEARARHRAQLEFDLGERLYFLGLQELRSGNELRARTAFMHSASHWGKQSRAGELLERLSAEVAAESQRLGELYLRLGMPGPAWLALREADRLKPGDAVVQGQLAAVEAELTARKHLTDADIFIRGGRIDEARFHVQEAMNLAGESIEGEAVILTEALKMKFNEQRYILGLACELDNQVVRAHQLYGSILVEIGDPDYEDVPRRYRELAERIEKAEVAYQQAIEARQSGDQETYRIKLAETLRHAGDYKDAAERFKSLPPQEDPQP